jgi:hypothetical protein
MKQEIAEYIKKQKSPQKEICRRIRAIILKTFPGIKEEVWVGVPFYDRRYYMAALKDHVNVGFSITGLPQIQIDLYEGRGKTMRHIKVHSLEDIDEKWITKLLKISKKAKRSC